MKIKDLKIGIQLRIGIAIILLLVIVLGYVSYQQADRIHQQTESMYQHPLKTRRLLGEITNNILCMRVNMRDFLLLTDTKARQSVLNEIAVNQINVQAEVEQLYLTYLGPRSDIDDFFKEYTKWRSIRDETVRIVSAGRLEEGRLRHVPGGLAPTQALKVLAALQKISNFAQSKGELLYRNSVSLKKLLNSQLVMLVSVILLLSFLINYIIYRNIRTPLNKLMHATQSFHDGNLDARSSYSSRNEFGKLSESFNNLAERIQKNIDLDKKQVTLAAFMLSEYDTRNFFHTTLSTLATYTDSQMAAIYLLREDKKAFEHFESIGIDDNARKSFAADNFEGEFGTALSSHKVQHIKDIHEDSRFIFYSVTGRFIPHEIITIPILAASQVIAVVSLATVSAYSKQSIQLIDNVLFTLSARIEGILAYHKIKEFAEKLEDQNRELEAQKTELASQSAELTEQNTELEMQKKQLDEANRMKTSFLSNMSHELRTPLNSVIALSGVLNRRLAGKVPDEEYGYLDVIERNGKQLLALINDILDLSRIEAGRDEMETNKFNVKDLILDVVEMIEPQAVQKNISLGYRAGDDLPEMRSDYGKCRHILQNIVANAVKFTEKGSVEITAKASADSVQIFVVDTGIGIEEEYMPYIFEEFRQADLGNSRKYGGSGLGLAIAKKYTDLLGGSISIESKYGQGSTFTLSLPVFMKTHVPDAGISFPDYLTLPPKIIPKRGVNDAKDKFILLVEDSDAAIIQMNDILSLRGYKVISARNGKEAFEQIELKTPDALILDLMMPGIDGFEVLRLIREQEKTAHLPVIILTAKYMTKEELSFLKHNGIHQLIQKGDINKEQLLEAVAGMVSPGVTEVKPAYKKAVRVSGTPVVLVIEDNMDNMLTIKALLHKKCTIIEAEDGNSGIDLAKQHKPHLILMDVALPGMNGIDALHELQKDEHLHNIPVIAVSASAMKGDKENFIALGFDGYISKPIDNDSFIKEICKWIQIEDL